MPTWESDPLLTVGAYGTMSVSLPTKGSGPP
jgi:hypothetical protein